MQKVGVYVIKVEKKLLMMTNNKLIIWKQPHLYLRSVYIAIRPFEDEKQYLIMTNSLEVTFSILGNTVVNFLGLFLL